ncbi:MAG: ABC transporter substrate-binding protein [Oscillospiraceae bacterium]|nr:ABC transporter substrate-binding protein [Oscillospiraceae bacterium]
MKKRLALAAATLLMSGCAVSGNSQSSDILDFLGSESSNTSHISEVSDNESSSAEEQTALPSDVTVIKWGVDGFSHEKESLDKLNERLAADGLRIEFVELDKDFDTDMTFSKLVEDYENENGSLDILTYGGDWVHKIGAVNIFIESGYFRELSAEDKAAFTDIPDICWDAAKVNGKHYTVPALSFGFDKDLGLCFHFNTKYISADKLENFGCTFAELEDILSGVSAEERLTYLEFQLDFLDFTDYAPASEMGGLYLSDKTMTAMNPYETEEVIEYARTLNSLYLKGYMNYEIDFSDWSNGEQSVKDFAVSVCGGRFYEETLDRRLGKDHQVLALSKPYYMENRLIDSTGIPVGSAHPDEAMELLKRLHRDKELSGLLSESERDAIGLPRDNEPVDVGDIKLSPFAGFQLKYTDIDEFKEVSGLCKSSFDKLCKAEDFDKTLAEINAELKDAGIDDYVERVNQRLEESNAASNQ